MIFPLAWAGAFAVTGSVTAAVAARADRVRGHLLDCTRSLAGRDRGRRAARRAQRDAVGCCCSALRPSWRRSRWHGPQASGSRRLRSSRSAARTRRAWRSGARISTSSTTIRCSAWDSATTVDPRRRTTTVTPRPTAARTLTATSSRWRRRAGLVGLAAFCLRVRRDPAARVRGDRQRAVGPASGPRWSAGAPGSSPSCSPV